MSISQKPPPTPSLRAEEVQSIIEERIFSGKLAPGAKINEKALAEELKISRTPVREALNALRHEGLISIIPNRGGFVSSLSVKEALDCYDVRGGLAYTAGKLLPYRISLSQLEHLRKMHTEMEQLLAKPDIKNFYQVNERFHFLLFDATGNQPLIAMNTAITRKLALYLHKEMSNPILLQRSNREHLEIINLIADGNAKMAAIKFENHILGGKESLLKSHR